MPRRSCSDSRERKGFLRLFLPPSDSFGAENVTCLLLGCFAAEPSNMDTTTSSYTQGVKNLHPLIHIYLASKYGQNCQKAKAIADFCSISIAALRKVLLRGTRTRSRSPCCEPALNSVRHYLRARSFLTLRTYQRAVHLKAIGPCPTARSVLSHHLESTNPALRDCPQWNDTLPGSWQVLVCTAASSSFASVQLCDRSAVESCFAGAQCA